MKTFDIIGQVEPVSDVNKLRQDKGITHGGNPYNKANTLIRVMQSQEQIFMAIAGRIQIKLDRAEKQRQERREKRRK